MADGFVVTHPLTPEDNVSLYRLIGGIFNRVAEAGRLAARFERTGTAASRLARRQVLYLIWRKKPWMASTEILTSPGCWPSGLGNTASRNARRATRLEINKALLDAAG